MIDAGLSDDTEVRQRLRAAEYLLRSEQLWPAHRAYEALLPQFMDAPNVVFPAAVLRHRTGHHQAGVALVQDYFRRAPVEEKTTGALGTRPLVLKMRGYNDTRVLLFRNEQGDIRFTLRGGHFSTQYLLHGSHLAQCEYTIAGDDDLRPDRMPHHDVLLNVMSDPDLEKPALNALQRFLDTGYDGPVINRPDRVLRTTRDGNYQRLQGVRNLTFPKTQRLRFEQAGVQEVWKMLEGAGFELPLILRRTGTQTARTTARILTRDDLVDYVGEGLTGEYYAITYRQILWRDDLFRKIRLFCIDGRFYPVVCHLDRYWNVHGANRKDIMRNDENLMEEEKRFLSDWRGYLGAKAVDTLERVAEDTGMEFFGVDFTLDEDGCPFIYELNASMRHSFDHGRNFPYKLPHDHAITDAFTAMIRGQMAAQPN